MVADTVVPGFPYEGALYWFLAENHARFWRGGYYTSLYGPNSEIIAPRATALVALFEKIIIAPADATLPDHNTYGNSQGYEHPDLRISMSWKYNEWGDENRTIAAELLKNNKIRELFISIPEYASDEYMKEHFLCRTLLQMRIADENNAILVGNTLYNRFYNEITSIVGEKIISIKKKEEIQKPWKLNIETLNISGLYFEASSIDSFAAIRESKEISSYAKEFRSAINKSLQANETNLKLKKLMKKAMDQEKVIDLAVGGFETLGSAANITGLIPYLGTIGSATAISSDVSSRALKKAKYNKQWYLLGPKMKEIALKDMLSK